MKSFTSILLLFFMTFFALVTALPIVLRDVFVPPVTYPHAGTVWKVGDRHNVTWDTSDAPVQITNTIGMVVLAKNGYEDIENPLAKGFPILDGRIEITVPDVATGSDYSVVVFGDSGNYSPTFTIKN